MQLSPTIIKKMIVNILHRYHVIIFVIFVLGGLAVVVLMLNNIINQSGNSSNYATETDTGFDQATIDRIKELKTRDEPADPLNLSGKRTNPFVE